MVEDSELRYCRFDNPGFIDSDITPQRPRGQVQVKRVGVKQLTTHRSDGVISPDSNGWVVGEWMSESHYLFNSQPRRSIWKDFPPADHTLLTRPEPVWQKMAQSPLSDATQPVDSEEEGRSSKFEELWTKNGWKNFFNYMADFNWSVVCCIIVAEPEWFWPHPWPVFCEVQIISFLTILKINLCLSIVNRVKISTFYPLHSFPILSVGGYWLLCVKSL